MLLYSRTSINSNRGETGVKVLKACDPEFSIEFLFDDGIDLKFAMTQTHSQLDGKEIDWNNSDMIVRW